MNRRHFISLLARTAAISTVAYSFPSIIRPRNIVVADVIPTDVVITPTYDGYLQQMMPRGLAYMVNSRGLWLIPLEGEIEHVSEWPKEPKWNTVHVISTMEPPARWDPTGETKNYQ